MVPLIITLSRGPTGYRSKDNHNEATMTSLLGQLSGPMKGLGIF